MQYYLLAVLIIVLVLITLLTLTLRLSTPQLSTPLDRAAAADYCEAHGRQLVSLATALRLPAPTSPRWIRDDLSGQLRIYDPNRKRVGLGEAYGERWQAWCL